MREIDKVRSLSAEELVKYFGVDCSRCGKCNSDDDADKKTYDDCVKGNIEFFNEPHSLEDLGYNYSPNCHHISEYRIALSCGDDIVISINKKDKTITKYRVCGTFFTHEPLDITLEELKIIFKMLEN